MTTGPNVHERYLQNIAKVYRQGELAANGGSTSRADLNNAGRLLDHIEAVVRD